MLPRRVKAALTLQAMGVLAMVLTPLVEARYQSSPKYYGEMLEINQRSELNDHAEQVHRFLDILGIPLAQRPFPPDAPSTYDFLEMPSAEGANAHMIEFSSTKPRHTPAVERPLTARDRRSLPYPFYKKSVVESEQTQRACRAHSEWKQIERATALENEEVIIGTRQWFWQTTCLDEGDSCYGFAQTPHQTSSCRPVFSWVVAWARPVEVINYTWRFIALKTCCSCAVTVKTPSR